MKNDGKKIIYSFRPLYRDLGTNLLIFTGSEVEDITIYKICKFENNVTRNGDIMMSLPKTMKTMGECGPLRNQTKYTSFERF